MDQTYQPSPNSYAADHVERYEASDGRDGGVMSGAPIVVLHTTGRKSGVLRKSPLIKMAECWCGLANPKQNQSQYLFNLFSLK